MTLRARTDLACVVAIVILAGRQSALQAQESPDPGVAVLSHLRSNEVKQALDVLGDAVDEGVTFIEGDAALASAAGGLYRVLNQKSTFEQYELLSEWTLPAESRETVRILTTPVARSAPPREFARLLGERPRDNSFQIARIGGVRGLFSTGWMLVAAADDIGRLPRLISELELLATREVPGASNLLTLARLAQGRPDLAALADNLRQRVDSIMQDSEPPESKPAPDLSHLAVAAAALEHEALRPAAEELLKALMESTYGSQWRPLLPALRIAHATAVQRHRGESGPEVLYQNRLKYWVPVSGGTSAMQAAGAVDTVWLTHEDHILHLTGAGNDVLFLRYPLTGEFTFTCETQQAGPMGTDGGLVYGGLQFQAVGGTGQLTVWDPDIRHQQTRPCPFLRDEQQPTFYRASIQAGSGGAVFLANLHPTWHDTPAASSSPWLGLRSFGAHRPVFRNLRLSGDPIIPREVRLSEGSELRGWQAGFLGESQPPFANDIPDPAATAAGHDAFDWSLENGVLRAGRRNPQPGVSAQSLLCYQRPLLDGESISYAYYYEPGDLEVHPALGRLAFLIEPGGVRIHWITDAEREWTGLADDNAVLEPLNRRGPATLPLRSGDWNTVRLTRRDESVQLSLNGELIYERPIDFDSELRFGLYRDRTQSAARVRNIALTGDWPDSVPQEFLENPAAVIDPPPRAPDRHALHRTFGDEFLAENVLELRRRAHHLPPQERFEFLSRHVLPGPDHPGFRIAAEYVPGDPSPPALQQSGIAHIIPNKNDAGSAGSMQGAELVSPVFDLIDSAVESGQLAELVSRIESQPAAHNDLQQRSRGALLALVYARMNEPDRAEAEINALHDLVRQAVPSNIHDQWPETLLVHWGLRQSKPPEAIGQLLLTLYEQRARRSIPAECETWRTHVVSLMRQNRHRRQADAADASPATAALQNWIPVVRERARSRGPGRARARWVRQETERVLHVGGHQEEFLYFQSPLRGDFAFECDIAPGRTHAVFAGRFCGPTYPRDTLDFGSYRQGMIERLPVDPPLRKFDEWARCRVNFRDGQYRLFINGRLVLESPLAADHDPWIGIRSLWSSDAEFRDVRITGNPEIPDAVPMSSQPDLGGWLTYYDETSGYEGADWQFVADPRQGHQIVGRSRPELAGAHQESLLRYHRPLVEDGSIEYEFYYEAGQSAVHPALDRLALLLDPAGVRVHWITDGAYDGTGIAPDNATSEPEHRRGPRPLPLIDGSWNRLRLQIDAQTLTLRLNGEPVFERELEATNRRTFGIFRFAESSARVRNVVMRGDWPKSLPPSSRQELADRQVRELDAGLSSLTAVFDHDFERGGLPAELFKTSNSHNTGQIVAGPQGIFMDRPANGQWSSNDLALPFSLHGDFDIEASFARLELETDFYSCIMVHTHLDDERQHQCRGIYKLTKDDLQRLETSVSVVHADGSRSYGSTARMTCEAPDGVLRLARRGDTVHYLFAENDSDVFRLIGSEVTSTAPTVPGELRLRAMADGNGRIRLLWKDITLRAQRITYLPTGTPQPRSLHVMKTDGSSLRTLTEIPDGFTHMGSPEWSADGRRIAFDASRGTVSTSHVFLIDADGTGLADAGPGCMPSFSPDGNEIVFSHSGQGILKMRTDGSNRRTIDPSGWGVQWSPKGNDIAYGKAGNITLRNLVTGQIRQLLQGEAASRYSYIYWNLGWSHDGRSIAFKGRLRQNGEDETAIVEVEPPGNLTVIHSGQPAAVPDFSWTGDNRRVVFSLQHPPSKAARLFTVSRSGTAAPELMLGQPPGHDMLNGDVSPDGTVIAFVSATAPGPIDWKGDNVSRIPGITQ